MACWHRALGALVREAGRTPSPNSGWPMAAAALVLDVHLRKPGVYILHPQGRAPLPGDIAVGSMTHSSLWLSSESFFYAFALALVVTLRPSPHAGSSAPLSPRVA